MSETIEPAVLEFFAALPQQGPGHDDETAAVLAGIAGGLPARPVVADLGCGTGRSTLVLARALPDAAITALDLAAPFVSRLEREVARRGLAGRVRVTQADMGDPPIEPGTVDLLWCEGAAYVIGFAEALQRWRPLLKPSGFCVVSECEWLAQDRPKAAVRFWAANYPAMASRKENLARAERAGYAVAGTHVLTANAWRRYYDAMARAIEEGRAAHLGPEFAAALQEERAVFAESGGSYGYVFYVLEPKRAA